MNLETNHRILIVDDNAAIHEDFQKILGVNAAESEFDLMAAEMFGRPAAESPRSTFELSFALQGAQAVELVKAAMREGRRYSVVFTDMRMPPGWDGLETTLKLWEIDPDLQIVICTAYSDHTWEEMMGKLGHPERVLILKKPFDTVEVLQLAHALSEKWTLLQSSRRNLEDLERLVGLRTVELQTAHRELQVSERRFRMLSSSAPIGIFETDAGGLCRYVNPQWEKISGLGLSEALGTGWQQVLHPEDSAIVVATWKNAVETGQPFDCEHRYRRADGEVRWIHSRGIRILSDTGEAAGHVGTVEDITDRKNVEHELSRARDAAIESAQLKSRFLANMSHEIRTPMNGILGMTDLALETEITAEQREYLSMTKTSAEALLRVIDDILDFSKIEAGKLVLEAIPFSLRECIATTLKPLILRAEQRGVALLTDLPGSVPDHVIGDPTRMRQILINLVDNALKFTKQGSVTLRVKFDTKTEADPYLHFSVIDTGPGIPEEKQALIFQAFAQADGTTTRTHGGTGLGLAIASDLVRKMGGKMWIESRIGEGTTFHFTTRLPVRKNAPRVAGNPEAQSLALDPQPPTSAPAARRALRILLAEDNAINRTVATRIMEKQGHTVVQAVNGREAVVAAADESIDLIFMDVQMPELDGFEATRCIREAEQATGRHTPIVAMTAHAMAGDRERCLVAEMDEYISKPIRKEELLRLVLRFSGVRRAPQPSPGNPPDGAIQLNGSASVPVATRSLPHFTREQLLETLSGDEQTLRDLISVFQVETPAHLRSIQRSIAERKPQDLAHSAHTLRGTFGAFGANHAGRLAQRLEEDAHLQNYEHLHRTFVALAREATRIGASLAEFVRAECAA